jgi:predicted nucleotidyltransferase
MPARIPIDSQRIAAFCRRWKVTEFALLGSVLRDDFRPDSDVDVLVTFEDGHGWSLFDLVKMTGELESTLGRTVDLVTRRAVETSPNPHRRSAILGSAEVVHAA